MKGKLSFQREKSCAASLLACALALGATEMSQAQIINLHDNNSTASINTGSSAGMFNWSLDGQNQLSQQWFWFRTGTMTREQSIDTISAPVIVTPDARSLYTKYFNGSYGVEIDYLLTGFSPGVSNQFSDISESITITNGTASALTFHFFQYSDFDLGGTTGGQTIQLGKNLRGLFNEAAQTFPGVALTETVVTPGANHGEAGLFNTTLAKLSDNNADNLNDNSGPLTGDATWALQWDFVIPGFSSVGISKDKYLAIDSIPEPCSAALVSLGLIAAGVYRRRRSA